MRIDLSQFWSRVQPGEAAECWLWRGSLDVYGYGIYSDGRAGTRKAHRIVWQLTHGVVLSSDELLCHHCDNPVCVNPAHLFIGTHKDNMRDKVAKGRCNQARERNNYAKLDPELVRQIREAVAAGGTTQCAVAQRFGISESLVSVVVNGRRWS
jgi:hypothetical protein